MKDQRVTVRLDLGPPETTCHIVTEDGAQPMPVTKLSLHGAQREVTGYLMAASYAPDGNWQLGADGELTRRFWRGRILGGGISPPCITEGCSRPAQDRRCVVCSNAIREASGE